MIQVWIDYSKPCHAIITAYDAWMSLSQIKVKQLEAELNKHMEEIIQNVVIVILPKSPNLE